MPDAFDFLKVMHIHDHVVLPENVYSVLWSIFSQLTNMQYALTQEDMNVLLFSWAKPVDL